MLPHVTIETRRWIRFWGIPPPYCSIHAASYKDVGKPTAGKFEGWLADLRDPANVAKLKAEFAQQAGDVTRVKAWEFESMPSMGATSKLQEICRGTAKDIRTKLDPLLAAAKPATPAQQEALRQSRAHWKQVQDVMDDFGNGHIGPITARQKLYQITGETNVHDIIDKIGIMLEGLVKFGG